MGKKHLLKHVALATLPNLGDSKKMMTLIVIGPMGVLYKQGTTKDAANFDRMDDTLAEYAGFMLRPMASKVVRTLIRPVGIIKEKPKWKYRLVTATVIDGGGSPL